MRLIVRQKEAVELVKQHLFLGYVSKDGGNTEITFDCCKAGDMYFNLIYNNILSEIYKTDTMIKNKKKKNKKKNNYFVSDGMK